MLSQGMYPIAVELTLDGVSLSDDVVHGLKVIDTPHHEVHDGEMYIAADLATFNGTRDILITTGTKQDHMAMEFICDGAVNVTVYRETTATASATAVDAINCNHNSINTALTSVCHTPTDVTAGTDIVDRYFNGGSTIGGRAGGTDRGAVERILLPSTKYLVRIVTTANVSVLTRFHWYEE
jgi:hypothetical protein